jgi:hypothetical protein
MMRFRNPSMAPGNKLTGISGFHFVEWSELDSARRDAKATRRAKMGDSAAISRRAGVSLGLGFGRHGKQQVSAKNSAGEERSSVYILIPASPTIWNHMSTMGRPLLRKHAQSGNPRCRQSSLGRLTQTTSTESSSYRCTFKMSGTYCRR